jgi:hypothetical protein
MAIFRKAKEPTAQQRVETLNLRAEAALSVFISTIQDLRDVVHDIGVTISANNLTISHLENCNAELQQVADKNTNIINNFTRLIEGDTEN